MKKIFIYFLCLTIGVLLGYFISQKRLFNRASNFPPASHLKSILQISNEKLAPDNIHCEGSYHTVADVLSVIFSEGFRDFLGYECYSSEKNGEKDCQISISNCHFYQEDSCGSLIFLFSMDEKTQRINPVSLGCLQVP